MAKRNPSLKGLAAKAGRVVRGALGITKKRTLKRLKEVTRTNPKEADIMFESGDFWVLKEKGGYGVYKSGVTHSTRDSLYAKTDDGLSIAIARAKYLASKTSADGSMKVKPNPQSDADAMFESFHGEPSTELITITEDIHVHEHLPALGTLVELRVRPYHGRSDFNIGFDHAKDLELENNPILWPWVGKSWVPYKTFTTEIAAQKVYHKLDDMGATVRLDQVRTQRFPSKYKWEVLVHRDSLPELLSERKQGSRKADKTIESMRRKLAALKGNPRKKGSYAVWVYSNAPGATLPTVMHFKTKAGVEESVKEVSRYGTAKKIVIVSPSGKQREVKANPRKKGPIAQASSLVSSGTGMLSKPVTQFTRAAGRVGGYLDGLMVNPKGKFTKKLTLKKEKYLFANGNSQTHTVKKPGDKVTFTWSPGINMGTIYEFGHYSGQVLSAAVNGSEVHDLFKNWPKDWPVSAENPQAIEKSGPGCTYLCSNEQGSQMFCIGGDQELDLAALKITGPAAEKELVTIGELTHVTYHTRKIFDGKPEEFDYVHRMGEKGGHPPVLLYDRVNKRLSISGGTYKIEKPFIGTSVGIEN